MGFTNIYHRNELMISSKGSWSTTTTTTIKNLQISIYIVLANYQLRQKYKITISQYILMQSFTNKDKKTKKHHCFLIYYSAIIYAISIYRFFTSFQFINLSNLKILVIVLCVSNMGQQIDNLEGNEGPNIKIKKIIPKKIKKALAHGGQALSNCLRSVLGMPLGHPLINHFRKLFIKKK